MRKRFIALPLTAVVLVGVSGLQLRERAEEEHFEPIEVSGGSDDEYYRTMEGLPPASGPLESPIGIGVMRIDPASPEAPLPRVAWLRLENPNSYPICFWGEGNPPRIGDQWNEPGKPEGWQRVNTLQCATGLSKRTLPPHSFSEAYAILLPLQRQQVILTFYKEDDFSVRSEQVIFETP